MSIERQDGLMGRSSGSLQTGDLARNYIGDNQPLPINRPMDEGTFDDDSPEKALISKERWAIVRQVVQSNPKVRPYLEWVLDLFSGYSCAEIAERYGVTRQVAFHKTTETIEYLRKRIQGHQF